MKRSWKALPIQSKLLLLVLSTSTVALLLACGAFTVFEVIAFRIGTKASLRTLARVIEDNCTAAVAFNDEPAAATLLSGLRLDPTVIQACIYTPDDRVFARYVAADRVAGQPAGPPAPRHGGGFLHGENSLYLFEPIHLKGEQIGTFLIQADLRPLEARLLKQVLVTVLALIASLLAALAVSRFLQRAISEPIIQLARAAETISSVKDYSVRVARESDDELGRLVDKFNDMLAQIQERDEDLERHRRSLEEQVSARTAELVEKNKELRSAAEAANAANRAKSQFLANVSHELRTPMHGILSFSKFGLEKGSSQAPEKLLDYFHKIDTCAKRLMLLLNDLLDMAKLEAGKMAFELMPGNLVAVVTSVLDELAMLFSDRGLRCAVTSKAEIHAVFDHQRIAQVLRNLIGNAVKFSPPDGEIEVQVRDEEGQATVSVLDRGPGIPESELEAIFDKFVQSERTKSRAGGTGLGLAISREILLAHEGRIWAVNREGGGSCITFQFPGNLPPLRSKTVRKVPSEAVRGLS
ncbi:MAG: ATP-binding protein [Thermoanaerobaculia bacterium]